MSMTLPFFMKIYVKIVRYFINMFLFKKNLNKFASRFTDITFIFLKVYFKSVKRKRIFD